MSAEHFAAVVCPRHGLVPLTVDEYERQMNASGAVWKCPYMCVEPMPGPCGEPAEFSDTFFEMDDYQRARLLRVLRRA